MTVATRAAHAAQPWYREPWPWLLMAGPVAVLIAYALTACVWTPLVPLTDGYALKGVVRYGLSYGPLRLWGSAAFIVGAIGCGLLADLIAPTHLVWVIAATAGLGALVGFGLQPLDAPAKPTAAMTRASALLLRAAGGRDGVRRWLHQPARS